jgi:hypothetical protein
VVAPLSGLMPIAGIHSVRAALRHGETSVDEVWLDRRRRDRRLGELAEMARGAGVRLRQVEAEEIERAPRVSIIRAPWPGQAPRRAAANPIWTPSSMAFRDRPSFWSWTRFRTRTISAPVCAPPTPPAFRP